jgi:hypothetical protein
MNNSAKILAITEVAISINYSEEGQAFLDIET